MRTETVEIYKYSELSEEAKERARDWYRQDMEFYTEHVVDDFITIAEMLGVTFDMHDGKRENVWYSVSYSQGDGAAFDGSYHYKKGAAKALKAYAPKDAELHRIADELQAVQRRNFYRLSAKIESIHGTSIRVHVRNDEYPYSDVPAEDEDVVQSALRDLAHWLYTALVREHEYQSSDEAVTETIEANEYEFNADGSIY